jgi:hypothetical protein
MTEIIRRLTALALTAALLLSASATTVTAAEPRTQVSSKQLANMISAVRQGPDASTREVAAERIPRLLSGADLSQIDAKTIEDLASLLDPPNNTVRNWVALSLSMFDARAKFAVPKLQAVYLSLHCASQRERDVATTIGIAIQRINGAPPPNTACLRQLGDTESA